MTKRQLEIFLGHSLGDPQRSRSYELERLQANGSSQMGMMMHRGVLPWTSTIEANACPPSSNGRPVKRKKSDKTAVL